LNRVVMRGPTVASPRSMAEFVILPEAAALVRAASKRGFLTIVVTNQPDIGRGLMSLAELELMHAALLEKMPLDDILTATGGEDNDPMRKPNPGMLLQAAYARNIDLQQSWLVGDSIKDMLAGKNAGTQTILLETPYNIAIHGAANRNFSSHKDIIQFLDTL
jgi:D-glycero-D-manno-heptose 1,7-bisphosphate phosphatase